MNHYDLIVIGGGVNGLVTASMIGKSGKKVLLLEARDETGGLASSSNFFSGLKANAIHDSIQWIDPRVLNDLKLFDYGLELEKPDLLKVALDKNGKHIKFFQDHNLTADSISKYSDKDAANWHNFSEHINKMVFFLEKLYELTPPKLPNISLKEAFSMRSMLSPIRKHGTRGLVDFLRIAPMMMTELMDEWFETELLRAAISTLGIRHISHGPFAAGTGYNFLHQHVHSNGLIHNANFVKGGTGFFPKALTKSAKSNGVEIQKNTKVKKINVNNESCINVVTDSGEKFTADKFVSSLDPKSTFLDLVGADNLSPSFQTEVQNIRYKGSASRIHLLLNKLPEMNGIDSDEMKSIFIISPSIEYLEKASDACKYGTLSNNPYIEFTFPTLRNTEISNNDKHILSATVQYTPYKIQGKEWSESLKKELQHNVINILENYIPHLSSLIDSTNLFTPLDIEKQFGINEGSLNHGEMTLDQFLFMRPTMSSAQYKTPIDNLYLCGSSTHPGGGIHGTNGYNASKEILKS